MIRRRNDRLRRFVILARTVFVQGIILFKGWSEGMKKVAIWTALGIGMATCGAVAAQTAPAPGSAEATEASIDAAEARATAEDFARILEDGYVFPDVAKRYAAMLRANAASGAYDGLGTAAAFADRVTADLRLVSPDNHLRLTLGRPGVRPPGPAPRTAATGPTPAMQRPRAIEESRWLAPGIAYIRFTMFPGDEEVTRAAAAFMASHASAKTLIFDIRTHRGGGLDQMDAIFPYLFARPTPLVAMDTRASVERDEGGPIEDGPTLRRVDAGAEVVRRIHSAIPHASEKRLFAAKVYVLTSGRSASAAEHFALSLKRTGRATLIGQPTAGAGHYGGGLPVGTRFGAFVPVGRTFDPDTNDGWEGRGVAPDVEVPAARALVEALVRSGVAAAEAERLAATDRVEGSMERRPRA